MNDLMVHGIKIINILQRTATLELRRHYCNTTNSMESVLDSGLMHVAFVNVDLGY